MQALQTLGTALGLTALAGINLYLTVFVTGLAIHFNWLQLSPQLAGLQILADPVVLTVAGILFAIEFVADKCPYVDSAWDSIHTAIRPVGGAFLALNALGTVDPVMEIVAVLLGGSIAFTTHSAKAGTRVLINTSPEPATNIAASAGEDVCVLAGLWLAFQHPILTLVLVVIFVVAFWYFAPKFFRMVKAHVIGIVHRFTARRRRLTEPAAVPTRLPAFAGDRWLDLQQAGEQVAWALPCFSGRMKPLRRNVRGCLLATDAGRLFFIGRQLFRARVVEIPVEKLTVRDDPGAVFHQVMFKTSDGRRLGVRLTRKSAPHVPAVLRWLEQRDQPAKPPVTEPQPALVEV